MTERRDIREDLGAAGEGPQGEGLYRVADRLVRSRPVPAAHFRGELGRRLLGAGVPRRRPARLRLLITAYAGSGLALLAVAALGVAGLGPLKADHGSTAQPAPPASAAAESSGPAGAQRSGSQVS